MKKLLLICLVSIAYLTTQAATCTAVTGSWYEKTTWLDGKVPDDGDVVIIPTGVHVSIDFNCGVYTGMSLLLNGTLDFASGRKFQMDQDGVLTLGGKGLISGGNGGSKFIIGNNEIYVGGNGDFSTGKIIGPSTCNAKACNLFARLNLEKFTTQQNEKGILVTWSTDTKVGCSYYFSLERSTDGINFEKIAQVNGVGKSILTNDYYYGRRAFNSYKWGISQSTDINDYSYLDETATQGYNFYRLKQTDFNGSNEYFNIVIVCNAIKELPQNMAEKK